MYKHLNISITLSDNSMTLRNDEALGNLIRSAEVITKVSDIKATAPVPLGCLGTESLN
jgi:hypothetical protein